MASNFPTNPNEGPEVSKVTAEEVLASLRKTLDDWDFDNPVAETLNSGFAINFTHWILENFGQTDNSGEIFLFPGSEGFDGVELPDELKQLIIYEFDGVHFSGENKVRMRSQHIYIEDEPMIPGWSDIRDRFTTFQEMFEYIKSRPEIVNGITPRRISYRPQVSIRFEPLFSYDWGLEFLVSSYGVNLLPYGQPGATAVPTEFVLQNFNNGIRLNRIVCELALLAANNASTTPRAFNPEELLQLQARIEGSDSIPPCLGKFRPRPGNSVMDLIIDKLS